MVEPLDGVVDDEGVLHVMPDPPVLGVYVVTAPDRGPVLSHGSWKTNGEMLADVARLGYVDPAGPVLDPTYGLGTFWTCWAPTHLVRTDLDPARSPDFAGGLSAEELPAEWTGKYRTVVIDPPYKLNGTDQGEGARYGVAGTYRSVESRHALMGRMLSEGARVLAPGGHLLFKCQDQTNGGRKRWQTRIFADVGEVLGLVLVDQFLFPGYRAQPARSTCIECGGKLMRRADGRWGTVKRDGSDPFYCLTDRHTDEMIGHVPDPAALGQDGSHVNYSALLVFEKPT